MSSSGKLQTITHHLEKVQTWQQIIRCKLLNIGMILKINKITLCMYRCAMIVRKIGEFRLFIRLRLEGRSKATSRYVINITHRMHIYRHQQNNN